MNTNIQKSFIKSDISLLESYISSKTTWSKQLEQNQKQIELDVKEDSFNQIKEKKLDSFLKTLFQESKTPLDIYHEIKQLFSFYYDNQKKILSNQELLQSNSKRIEIESKLIKEMNQYVSKSKLQYEDSKVEAFLVYKNKISNIILENVQGILKIKTLNSKISKENEILSKFSFESVFLEFIQKDSMNGFTLYEYYVQNTQKKDLLDDIDKEIASYIEIYREYLQIERKKNENEIQMKLDGFKKDLYQELEKINYEFPEMKEIQIRKIYQKLEKLKMIEVTGDGHCLARSISYLIYGNQNYYFAVYDKMISFLEKEGKLMEPKLKEFDISYKNIETHLKKIRNQRVVYMEDWPNNNVYLQIIVESFKVNMELFYFEEFPKYTDLFKPSLCDYNENRRTISLANLNNSHYSPLESM